MRYNRICNKICSNGFFLTFIKIINKIINKIYSFLIFGTKINIKSTSKIMGKNRMLIGENFLSGRFLWLEVVELDEKTQSNKIVIKNNVIFNDFVHVAAVRYVEIGNNVLVASRVYISDHNHGYYSGLTQSSPLECPEKRAISCDQKVIIGDNVWIGEGVCVLPGVTIGNGCVIGANAVVTKDIPENSIAVGVPAKIIKQYDFEQRSWL